MLFLLLRNEPPTPLRCSVLKDLFKDLTWATFPFLAVGKHSCFHNICYHQNGAFWVICSITFSSTRSVPKAIAWTGFYSGGLQLKRMNIYDTIFMPGSISNFHLDKNIKYHMSLSFSFTHDFCCLSNEI